VGRVHPEKEEEEVNRRSSADMPSVTVLMVGHRGRYSTETIFVLRSVGFPMYNAFFVVFFQRIGQTQMPSLLTLEGRSFYR